VIIPVRNTYLHLNGDNSVYRAQTHTQFLREPTTSDYFAVALEVWERLSAPHSLFCLPFLFANEIKVRADAQGID
jgi:hypothetical protein